jgi:hypothetical protein
MNIYEEILDKLEDFWFWLQENWVSALLTLLLVALVLFVGIYEYKHYTGIKEGFVTSKDFDPASCTTTYISQKVGDTTVMTPMQSCHGDTYTLWIADKEENTNWFEVPADVWNDAELGNYFDSKCMCLRGNDD